MSKKEEKKCKKKKKGKETLLEEENSRDMLSFKVDKLSDKDLILLHVF